MAISASTAPSAATAACSRKPRFPPAMYHYWNRWGLNLLLKVTGISFASPVTRYQARHAPSITTSAVFAFADASDANC